MTSELDVIVVGGGPAGSAAAISCAQRRLRVMLFERQAFPRDHPGESLHPGVEALFKTLGCGQQVERCGFLRYPGHWLSWNGPWRFVPFGGGETAPWLGYQAWRADFDGVLLEHARKLGVNVMLSQGRLSPTMKGSRITGVRCGQGVFSSRHVIDASGGRHWLPRERRQELQRFSPRLIALYGYCQGDCPELNMAPLFEADGAQWTWMARVRPGIYAWTRVCLGSKTIPERRVPRALGSLTPRGAIQGTDVTWRLLPESAGAGYFVVGDAAAVLDPASSHGVLRALMSGMMAAHLIGLIHWSGARERTAIGCYRDWLRTAFEHDVNRLKDLYRELSPCPDWLLPA